MNNSDKNDYYNSYNGFNNISKSKNHVITTKNFNSIGICDLNDNCSNIELNISKIRNNIFNPIDLESIQSNKIILEQKKNQNQSNISLNTTNRTNTTNTINTINTTNRINTTNKEDSDELVDSNPNFYFNYDNIIITIFVILLIIYLLKKK